MSISVKWGMMPHNEGPPSDFAEWNVELICLEDQSPLPL